MAINTKYKVTKGSPESLLSVAKISDKDLPLIQRLELDTAFTPSGNRIDVFFYALDGRFLSSIIDSKNYSVIRGGSTEGGIIEDITLNPQKDSTDAGYVNGDVNVLYNFVNNLLSEKNAQPKLFIESISPDRTEIRALTNDVSTRRLIGFIDNAKARLNDSSYFEDFRLNFGRNNLPIGINLDRVPFRDTQAVIIKLYEPLPTSIQVKDTFLLEELVGDSVLYQVETEVSSTAEDVSKALRGPNYNIELVEENNNPTGYLSYNELFSYPVTNSYYEVYSLFNEKGAQLSIDHTDFSDFIHFSSAEERLRNFYYKASLLESYRNQIDARNTYTGSIDESIRGIINNFDHYDRYLYFETGSTAWPKNTIIRPYRLQSTGSSEVQTWYTDQLNSASLYDAQNNDRLINSIPSFIREDTNNAPYALFVDMVGQHFDNLWIYMKGVTSKYDADNRLDFGISKDLVREAVEGFGVTLYNNNEALENLFAAFTGETYDSGSEQISSLIVAVEGSGSLTGSIGNEHLQPMPKSSYQKEVYKRIYHNIPLLTKSKGTERGLRALINSFGIPSDVLKIRTFGGQDTTATPFYGPSTEVTSSLGKIRVSNTDAVVTGSTLSNYTSVVNYGDDYSKDLHTVEIGFSPTDNLDSYIKSHPSMSAFDLDSYIGDPGYAYSGSYSGLSTLAETVFTSGSAYAGVYNAFDFVRLIKFFDNSIFRIIKDFVPARSNIDTGIIIKPHILDRSKIKQPQVEWSNQSSPSFTHTGTQLDYTGSYYSTNFSIDGNISTGFITGSTGLNTLYTSSYTEVFALPSGGYSTLVNHNHDEASYTGEYSGSILHISNGDLTTNNTFRKLEPEQFSFKYIPRNDFNVNTTVADLETTVTIDIVSGSINSPDQSLESPLSLELSITDAADYTANFKLTGGSNYDSPQPDSGSIVYIPDQILENGQSLLIGLSVDFASLQDKDAFANSGGNSKVTLEIVSSSVVVASGSVERDSNTSSTKFTTVSYKNSTGGDILYSLDSVPPDLNSGYHYRVKYSSNITSLSSVDFTDASISLDPRRSIFDNDAVTLWIDEVPSTFTEFTSSFVKAISVPLKSDTNGSMLPYIKEASEVVFRYPAYTIDTYDPAQVTESIEGGSYKANTIIEGNDIYLTHITSAPYSASFTQPLPDLVNGKNIQFNFTVDFDSYWSTYLDTYNLANTPYVTASIRNSNTGVVTGSLSFDIQQGQYPNRYKRSLVYENNTGGTLSDLEFYYQVNVPKSKGAGFPKINLENVSINYRTPGDVFINTKIKGSKKLSNAFYFDVEDVEVYSGSLTYFEASTDYYNVGFLAGESELFRFNDYAAISNNVDSLRRSNMRLLVDEKTYTPSQGSYKGFFLPANYAILSSSIANGVEGLDERLFAEIQDSNYYSTGWKNARYEGTETNNRRRGVRVLGLEPSRTFNSFTSYEFLDTATTASIKALIKSVDDAAGEDRQDLTVYYNRYESKLLGDVLLEITDATASLQTSGPPSSAFSSFNNSGYSFNVTASISSYEYSGSIGELIDGGRVDVDFNVGYTYFTDAEISSSEYLPTLQLIDGVENTAISSSAVTFADGTAVSVGGFTDTYNYKVSFITDTVTSEAIVKWDEDILSDPDAIPNANISMTINSIKKSNLIPVNNPSGSITAETPEIKTFFYREVKPTPSSPSGFETITNSKLYRLDTDQVFTTDDRGIVTNIE